MRVVFAIMVLAACDSGPRAPQPGPPPPVHTVPKALWSFDPQSYFSDRDFLDGSAFSRDLVVLANVPPGGSGGSIGVVALDVKTGTRLWGKAQLGWLLHPPHATEPLYFAPYEKLGEYNEGYTHVDKLDPRTGKVLATIKLARSPQLDFEMRIVWSERGIVVIGDREMSLFDWTTGKPRWTTPVGDHAYLFAPLVLGDRIYLPGTSNVIVSLADGVQLAAISGECCDVRASPDGKHVFVRAAVNGSAEIGPDLKVVRHITGEVRHASNTHYVVDTSEGAPAKPAMVQVYAYGNPTAQLVLHPKDKDDFYGALALDGRYLLAFHNADASFQRYDITTGKPELIETIGSHFVLSTDAVGTAGPLLNTPPVIERPYLFTEEWGVHGYLVGDD
jgi:outer membrane protein assembly factor BamB